MKKILIVLCLFIAQSAFALLPPAAQSIDELRVIINDNELGQRLGYAEPIEQIVKTESGYLILTPSKQLEVSVLYIPNKKKIGPAQFNIKFQNAVPRNGR
jgi:hypothetical protein